MPLYDYHCNDCGDFRAWRRMSEADAKTSCPTCATPARRAMVAPGLALMASNTRIAHTRNEKSADQPQVMTKKGLHQGDAGQPRAHCDHHHHGQHQHAHGRPWMIGH